MFILELNQELIDACGDPGLATILQIAQNIMGIIQVVVPILLIIAAIWMFTRLMMNPEEKKLMKALRNCIFAAVIVFFLPYLVNLTMSWLDDSFNAAACWNVAKEAKSSISWNDAGDTSDSSNNKKLPGIEDYQLDGSTGTDDTDDTSSITKDKTYKIAFVGNSKTYRNNVKHQIAKIFEKMAKNGGYQVDVTIITASGVSLSWHGNNSIQKLQKKYDIAVLQEATGVYEQKSIKSFKNGAKKVASYLRSKNKNINIYLRQVWVHRSNLNTSIQTRSYNHATEVAKAIDATIIPDGKAFNTAIKQDINCFSDNTHQSAAGAYLSAACIYKKVTGGNPENLSYTGYVSNSRAKKLRKIANSVC